MLQIFVDTQFPNLGMGWSSAVPDNFEDFGDGVVVGYMIRLGIHASAISYAKPAWPVFQLFHGDRRNKIWLNWSINVESGLRYCEMPLTS